MNHYIDSVNVEAKDPITEKLVSLKINWKDDAPEVKVGDELKQGNINFVVKSISYKYPNFNLLRGVTRMVKP